MNSSVYILLPVFNRRLITEIFVNCLLKQAYQNYHLILIDDGSTDGTDRLVEEKLDRVVILKGFGDWWWAGSLQQGINWLKRNGIQDRDIVVFMNDDIVFAPDFLKIAIELLNERGGMLLPQVVDSETGRIEESGVSADLKRLSFVTAETPENINCLPTRGLFMTMGTLRMVGDFYPKLLPHYLSDYEFTIRAKKMGVRLTTSSKLLISVDESATGFRVFDDLSFLEFIKRYFSNKSTANPIHWSNFIFLTSPKLFVPWNIFKVWRGVVKIVLMQAVRAFATYIISIISAASKK
jgi:GT2 family glycosyltransferase